MNCAVMVREHVIAAYLQLAVTSLSLNNAVIIIQHGGVNHIPAITCRNNPVIVGQRIDVNTHRAVACQAARRVVQIC